MQYPVNRIKNWAELETCPRFEIDNFLWTCKQKPPAYGWMGYSPDEGFLLRMVCEEANPKRTANSPQEMVCGDSALEAFFAFPVHPTPPDETFFPSNDGLYLNFEVNANGAMYAKYGNGRRGRQPITPEEYRATNVRAQVFEDRWQIDLCVPQALIKRVCGIERFLEGDIFYCNFYKISEDPQIEHYASYHPVDSATPNFHLPEQFAKAIITGG